MRLPTRLLILFLLPYGGLCGQYNQTENFDVTDGMAMTEATTVYCDKSGRIWTLHNNYHISCYDGAAFTTYQPAETGHYSAGAVFMEDTSGLWIFTSTQSVSFFNGQKWQSWDIPLLTGTTDKGTHRFVLIDSTGSMNHYNHQLQKWIPHGRIPERPANSQLVLSTSLRDETYLLRFIPPATPHLVLKAYTTQSLFTSDWLENHDLLYTDFDYSTYYTYSFPPASFPGFKSFYLGPSKEIAHNGLQSSHDKNVMFMSGRSINLNQFEVDIYITDDSFQMIPYARILHSETKLGIALDHAGRLWIASQSGLMRVYPDIILCREENPNMVPSLHAINEDAKGNIWFGGYGSGLCYFDGADIHPPPEAAKKYKSFLPGSYRDHDGNMGFWTEDYKLVKSLNGSWSHTTVPCDDPGQSGYYFLTLASGKLAAGLGQTLLGIVEHPLTPSESWKFVNKSKGQLLENILTIAEDHNGKLWLGRTGQGVSVYDPVTDTARTWNIQPDTPMNFGMASSVMDQQGRLWMGCNDGIRVIEKPHAFTVLSDEIPDVVRMIQMEEAGNSLVSLMKIYSHYLVFGNQAGYGFLDLHSYANNPASPLIHYYPTHQFLQSCDQNIIHITANNKLWIGQDKGAMCIDMNKHKFDTLPAQLIAKSISIRESSGQVTIIPFDTTLCLSLPVKKRSFTVQLANVSPGWLNNNTGISYRILNDRMQDTTWSAYTKDLQIKVDYLPPRNNTLQIRTIKNNQVADEMSLELIVPRTLDESPYFWVTLFGSLSLIGFLFTRHTNRQQIKLKQAEIELSEQRREKEFFQIRAIANSLNPHFIKNSLNWAQTRFRSDHKVATVIDELSSNISTIFKRSREGQAFHSLKDEFELVRNHLSIQQATYGNFLAISLPDPALIETYKNIMVPLMQIQIHVENAIEHGIRNRVGANRLDLHLEDEKDYVHLTITDDGIGRAAAEKLGSHGTQQGIFMLESLYQIFNKYNTHTFSSHYEDLPLTDPATGNPIGTRVHILIPKKYTYQAHENHSILHS